MIRDFQYVSIVGMNYLHPIAAILEKALSRPHTPPNEVQTSPLENGYSIALVTLSAMLAESAIRRTQYVLSDLADRSPLIFVQRKFPACPALPDLVEVFVARDVIAHNHVWEASVQWDDTNGLNLVAASKVSGGDRKYDDVIVLATRTTKRLGVNLFPPRVNLRDVALALRTTGQFLDYLENEDRRYFYMTPQIVEFRGQLVGFKDLVSAAERSVRAA